MANRSSPLPPPIKTQGLTPVGRDLDGKLVYAPGAVSPEGFERELPSEVARFDKIHLPLVDKHARLINKEGRLIDKDGQLVDKKGRLINKEGRLINKLGHLVDERGHLIDEYGRLVDLRGRLVDEHGRLIDEHGRLINAHGHLVDEEGHLVNERGVRVDQHGRELAHVPLTETNYSEDDDSDNEYPAYYHSPRQSQTSDRAQPKSQRHSTASAVVVPDNHSRTSLHHTAHEEAEYDPLLQSGDGRSPSRPQSIRGTPKPTISSSSPRNPVHRKSLSIHGAEADDQVEPMQEVWNHELFKTMGQNKSKRWSTYLRDAEQSAGTAQTESGANERSAIQAAQSSTSTGHPVASTHPFRQGLARLPLDLRPPPPPPPLFQLPHRGHIVYGGQGPSYLSQPYSSSSLNVNAQLVPQPLSESPYRGHTVYGVQDSSYPSQSYSSSSWNVNAPPVPQFPRSHPVNTTRNYHSSPVLRSTNALDALEPDPFPLTSTATWGASGPEPGPRRADDPWRLPPLEQPGPHHEKDLPAVPTNKDRGFLKKLRKVASRSDDSRPLREEVVPPLPPNANQVRARELDAGFQAGEQRKADESKLKLKKSGWFRRRGTQSQEELGHSSYHPRSRHGPLPDGAIYVQRASRAMW